jgi:hypothetical protein
MVTLFPFHEYRLKEFLIPSAGDERKFD